VSSDGDPGAGSGDDHDGAGSDRFGGKGEVLRQTLADHAVHIAVIAVFAVYPLLYTWLTGTGIGTELDVVLPRTRTMVAVLYVGLFAISFDFISGYTGYLSFGHALFYGIGAYFVALTVNGKVPFLAETTPLLLMIVLAGLLAAVVALAIGAVSFRLTGVYFAMITLGFAEVGHVFIRNWDYVGSNPRDGIGFFTGVDIGLPDWWLLPGWNVTIGQIVGDEFTNVLGTGIDLSKADVSFYAIGIVVLVCYFLMQRIIHSPYGRVMIAIRENEERARAVGYNTFRYKMGAFAISGFFGAVAGGLFAGYKRSVSPENSFDLFVTADALLAAIIGGFGTLAGPLYGILFQDVLEGILSTDPHGLARYLRENLPSSILEAGLGDATVLEGINVLLDGRAGLYLGIVFILFVLYVPHGILGTLRNRLGGTVAEQLPARLRRYVGRD